MALTKEFRRTVMERARRDATFRQGLLAESVERLRAGEGVRFKVAVER